MPDWLFSRSFIIALAVIGGLLSLLASWCQSRDSLAPMVIWLNKAAYGFMAVSIGLFIAAGFFGVGK